MREKWAPFPGHENTHQVSNLGRVRSVMNGVLRGGTSVDGYLVITLRKKNHKIHRVIANVFVPNPENRPIVNHKDRNKKNNAVSNLEWVTNRENVLHYYAIKKASVKSDADYL